MIKRLAATLVLLTTLALLLSPWDPVPSAAIAAIPAIDSTQQHAALTAADSARALEKLAGDIRALLTMPETRNGKVGVEIRSLVSDHSLFSLNADAPLTPASNTKVVTAFTALSELGPNYSVKTVLAAEAKPQNGVLKGNLYVKGYGDPLLTVNDIDQLVDQFVNSGVKQIDGNVVGDGSFFDNKTERVQYSGDKDVVEPLPPIAALTLDYSVFTLVISSPRTPGLPCNVQTIPHSAGFEIVNNAVVATPRAARSGKRGRHHAMLLPGSGRMTTERFGDEPADTWGTYPLNQGRGRHQAPRQTARPAGRKHAPAKPAKGAATRTARGHQAEKAPKGRTAKAAREARERTAKAHAVKETRHVVAAAKPAPKQAGAAARQKPNAAGSAKADAPAVDRGPLKITMTAGENGRQVITVTGSMAPNRTASYRYQMRNAPLVIAGMIYDRLRLNGITINGQATAGVTPAKYRTLSETGRPLIDILRVVMKNSNNFLAEYVFKMIGGAAGGQQETAQKSVQKIQYRMTINRIPFERCLINDGSGLSRANCLTASTLVGILHAAYNDKKIFESLYSVMSIAGVDGTLRHRMRGTYAEKNVHGKTGTLNNVSALCGYVTTRDGEFVCFSMLMNGGNHGLYRSVQDKVAARLAAFSYHDASPAKPAAADD
ncbi:MAG TPA: D-alanyl-D-alanine carboxypeptidase/D-alanyl-D-alanine-endopeptidase [Candidatus Kapabacteria bacterium]|nr:D-alanyl-D-alanine carboxypeptidase/D-alanyl-D-alanine-endopeptidase [Candidatus Kapabacteria bacterium]